MKISVVYAAPAVQKQIEVRVDSACDVQNAIMQSGVLMQFPEIDLNVNKVGIWGKIVSLNTEVTEGDRIEIYRPLLMDPKQIRKLKAKTTSRSK